MRVVSAQEGKSIKLTYDRSRQLALGVLCAGMLMIVLDQHESHATLKLETPTDPAASAA